MNKFNITKFGQLAGLIKNVKRSGWLRYLPPEQVQSVGDHSAKIALLTFALKGVQNVDYQKCMEMAIMHDIAQGIVGDFTPYDKITKQEKYDKQLLAVQQIFESLGDNKQYFLNRWKQFEQGKCFESILVKDLDKLEMIQQAFQYEKKYQSLDLSQFYQSVKNMKTDIVKKWAQQLIQQRNIFLKIKSKI